HADRVDHPRWCLRLGRPRRRYGRRRRAEVGHRRRAAPHHHPAVRPTGKLITSTEHVRRGKNVIPAELRYTVKHEWLAPPQSSGAVRVGITDYAQDALGDIVYVDLPEVGTAVEAGQPFGEVESTKSASEIYAPVSGTVLARNEDLKDHPELI